LSDTPDPDVTTIAESLLESFEYREGAPPVVEIPSGILGVLHYVRAAISRLTTITGRIAWMLVWAVFVLGLFNVITRYAGRFVQQDIIIGEIFDLQWMLFGTLFLLSFNYGLREGVNPRIDFWWANFSDKKKAFIDLVIHVTLFMPFLWLGIRLLWPYAMSGLGRKFDGRWSTWQVWKIWEQSGDAGGLTRGPIKFLMLVGFVLFALQLVAEIIKTIMVLAGRTDLATIAKSKAPVRIE
jgi:TRAP-type mannitol/chloroaromatic compound transport system permease small subunit